jgi:hypothetical protein
MLNDHTCFPFQDLENCLFAFCEDQESPFIIDLICSEIKKWDINLYLYICMFLRFVYKTVIFDNMNDS